MGEICEKSRSGLANTPHSGFRYFPYFIKTKKNPPFSLYETKEEFAVVVESDSHICL